MSLQDLLGVSVSVASRTQEAFVKAPSSVTVFTRAEILNMGVRTVEELLSYAPGIYSARAGSSSYSVSVRGKTSSQLSNDVLFLLNGQRLNDDFSNAALLFNRLLTTGNIEQVEVVRGPGSALYGSDALLGVVNIVTADDLDRAFVAAGSSEHREASLSLSRDFSGIKTSAFFHVTEDEGEDFVDPTSPDLRKTRDPRKALSAQAVLETERTRLEARYARFDLDDFYLFAVVPSDPDNDYRSSDAWLSLSHHLWEGDAGRLTGSVRYRMIDHESLAQPLPGEVMEVLKARGWTLGTRDYLAGAVVEQSELTLALDGEYRLTDGHSLVAGAQFRRTRFDKTVNQNNYESADVSRFLPCIEGTLAGETELPPRCDFTFIRYYGRVRETTDFAATGQSREMLGLYVQDKIRLTPSLEATLGLRFDHYSDFGSTINPRAALVYSHSDDTTLKLMYGEAFRAPTVSELELKNTPDITGNPDLENLGSLSLNYRLVPLNLNLNGIYRGSAESGSNPPADLDAHWIVNANLRYRLGGLTLVGGVYNLFDEEYFTYTTTPLPEGLPNRGREYRLGLELDL